jgi:hypothetical protein
MEGRGRKGRGGPQRTFAKINGNKNNHRRFKPTKKHIEVNVFVVSTRARRRYSMVPTQDDLAARGIAGGGGGGGTGRGGGHGEAAQVREFSRPMD